MLDLAVCTGAPIGWDENGDCGERSSNGGWGTADMMREKVAWQRIYPTRVDFCCVLSGCRWAVHRQALICHQHVEHMRHQMMM